MERGKAVWRRYATYFFTFHTISDHNTACKEIRRKERALLPPSGEWQTRHRIILSAVQHTTNNLD